MEGDFPRGGAFKQMFFEMNPGSKQKYIFFSFNLPIDTTTSLWACFYTPIMGMPIKKKFFASLTAIRNNVAKLNYIDKATHSNAFINAITGLSRYGFLCYIYLSSNNSKHFKRNYHILITTIFDSCDTKDLTTTNFFTQLAILLHQL